MTPQQLRRSMVYDPNPWDPRPPVGSPAPRARRPPALWIALIVAVLAIGAAIGAVV